MENETNPNNEVGTPEYFELLAQLFDQEYADWAKAEWDAEHKSS